MQQMQQFLINPPGGPPQIIQIPLNLLTQANTPSISLVTANGQIIQIPTNFQATNGVEMTNATPLATTTNVGFPSSTPIKKDNDFLGATMSANCLNSPNVSASPLACGPSATPSVMPSSIQMNSSQMIPSAQPQQTINTAPPPAPANTVNGVNLDEIKEFAKAFKMRRLALGLTQTQLGQALSATRGPAYSQSAICRFEKLDITPQSAAKIKPVLEKWMQEVESKYGDRLRAGGSPLTFDELVGDEISRKKRKRRTSFTPEALSVLNEYFDRHSNPTPEDIIELSQRLNIDREVVRVWFCNKRQALKNMGRKLTTSASASMNASLSDDLSNSFSVSSPGTMTTTSATLDQL